jgi:LacI family transcriptional regulator
MRRSLDVRTEQHPARTRKVALLLPVELGYCRGVIRGTQQYAVDHGSWIARLTSPVEASIQAARDWGADGIIALGSTASLARQLAICGLPAVNVTASIDDDRCIVVDVDHEQVGRLAAGHFLERGFRSFGFYGNSQSRFARLRHQGFATRLADDGFDVAVCNAPFSPLRNPDCSWSDIDSGASGWLRSLPRNVGILASNDGPARELVDAARLSGLRVPEDIAVLGVDDDELECTLSAPPLSSVVLPAERIGYEAARLLDDAMLGRATPAREVLIPPVCIVTRRSTDIVAIDDEPIAAAIRFIRMKATEGVRVADVLAVVPIARRTLEKKFNKLLGRGPFEEIRRVQTEAVKRLLADGTLTITEIAIRCGFDSSQSLAVAFRSEVGMSCSDFRRLCRPDRPASFPRAPRPIT